MPSSSDYPEVETLLNKVDSSRARRREHHLPREAYRYTDVAFFLTLCARHQGEPFRSTALAQAIVDSLEHRRRTGVWRVYAFCLMPDHLHAVVQLLGPEDGHFAQKDLLRVMGDFRSYTTRVAWKHGICGRLWQHDQYDRLLRSDKEFTSACHYTLNNPVRKGLAEDWTQWPYSASLDEW